MVVSYTNVLFVVDRESAKMVANNKLDVLENSFNSKEDKYKMIFITRSDWDNYMKNYDKTKIYKYIDDSEYINEELSQSLAKDLFGDDVNIE